MFVVGKLTYSNRLHCGQVFAPAGRGLATTAFRRLTNSLTPRFLARRRSLWNPEGVFGQGVAFVPRSTAPPCSIHSTMSFSANLFTSSTVRARATCGLLFVPLELGVAWPTGGAGDDSCGNVTVSSLHAWFWSALFHAEEKRMATGLWTRITSWPPVRTDTKSCSFPLSSLATVSLRRSIVRGRLTPS